MIYRVFLRQGAKWWRRVGPLPIICARSPSPRKVFVLSQRPSKWWRRRGALPLHCVGRLLSNTQSVRGCCCIHRSGGAVLGSDCILRSFAFPPKMFGLSLRPYLAAC